MNELEHPGIRECQITGGRDTPDDTEYKCPECGAKMEDKLNDTQA